MVSLLRAAFAAALLTGLATTSHGQSALDGFDPNADGTIRDSVVQLDGKILLGGSFTTLSPNGGGAVTRNNIARLNPDGTLDTAFNPNANGVIYAIAVQPDGKILAGGLFTSIGGQTRNRIARLDPITGLADSFDPNANSEVYSIVLQSDGKILTGGLFTNIGGATRNFIARLDPTSGLADSFNPNATNSVTSIVVQADGKILAGGAFSGTNSIGSATRNYMARLDPTTGLADSFDPNANSVVFSIAIQADGKILAGGNFSGANSIGGATRNYMARLDPATGLADSFDPNANDGLSSIAVQADGKILVSGLFNDHGTGVISIGGAPRNHIARLDPTTGLADSFNPNANNAVFAIAVQPDGKIVAGGTFTTVAPNGGAAVTRNRVARLENDGRLDRTLNLSTTGGVNTVETTAIQPDGKILIGGGFVTVLGVARNRIARLNTDGTLDTAFNPNSNNAIYSIAVQPDGQILAGGNFTSIGGQPRNYIARLDATTGLADSFNPNASARVLEIVRQIDGKILVGGEFTSIGGQPRNRIGRLDATTALADSFDPNANSWIFAIAPVGGGKILAAGLFTNIGGQPRNYIARLDATTGLADSFDPNAGNFVRAIVVQPDGQIVVGGDFTSIGGATRNRIARLDANTGLADSFNPNANNNVYSLAAQADGKILAGGFFAAGNAIGRLPITIGGHSRNRLARLDPNTGLADSFNPNASSVVYTVALPTDGKVLAGGSAFFTIGGQTRNAFARLTNIAAFQELAVAQTAVVWIRGGSSPQFRDVIFEYSTDSVTYNPLGNGTASGPNWSLTGLNLPIGQNIQVRARGYDGNSITESVRNAYLIASATTPTPTATPFPTPSATPTPTAAPSVSPTPTPVCWPTITHSTSQTIAPNNSISCNNGVGHAINSYWRAFNMAAFAGSSRYDVTSVSFGVESANNPQSVTVRLFAQTGSPFPGGTRTQIATTAVNLIPEQSGTIVTTPLLALVPAGTLELVMELNTPFGQTAGNLFFPGTNTSPETGPSYLNSNASGCAISAPTTMAALGFPDVHLVFNVSGSCSSVTPTPTPSPGNVTHFSVVAPGSVTGSVPFNFTVTALDQFNNTIPSYAGTVHFTTTDDFASLPPDSTLTNGTGTFSATLGEIFTSQTITATDTVNPSITGTSNNIFIGKQQPPTPTATPTPPLSTPSPTPTPPPTPAPTPTPTATSPPPTPTPTPTPDCAQPAFFDVDAPPTATVGVPFNFTVRAMCNPIFPDPNYFGVVHFTSSDPAAQLPPDSGLNNGFGSFSATLHTVGSWTITVVDASNSSITGTSGTIVIGPTPTPTPPPTPTAAPTSTPAPTPTPTPFIKVTAPTFTMDVSDGFVVNNQPVTTTFVDPSLNYVGFQADMVYDSAIAAPTPATSPVLTAGLTASGWTVSGNIINSGPGTLRTLRVSAFSNDGLTPLSGAGTLYLIRWKRVSNTPGTNTPLTWAAFPNDFEFVDADLNLFPAPAQNNGSITITGVPTPTPTPPPPSPTPTPISVSGTVRYCSNPVPGPVPNVTLSFTGNGSGSTLSDASGNYQFSFAPNQGYTVTPTKAARVPGSPGISTVDVVAIQRHFLVLGTPLSGCRLTAADVNGNATVDTVDVIATQRFFLALSTGLANVGKYQFSPASRIYATLVVHQTGQDYNTLIFGDVVAPFVE